MMLIILEMANNANGDVSRGIEIIDSFAPLVKEFPSLQLAFKFQYRDASILRPGCETGMTRRIASTMLSESDRYRLKEYAVKAGFKIGCTPFDEPSVDIVKAHSYDFLKVASCSLTDWPLLEEVATAGLPVIASTGGADIDDVRHAAQFLSRRVSNLLLMHCVSMYPTGLGNLGMDRIDQLRTSGLPVGFSTHEDPESDWGVLAAVAKGCELLEWHVSVPPMNSYSLTVDQCRRRLQAVATMLKVCRPCINEGEEEQLQCLQLQCLRRGVWATRDIASDELVTADNTVLQMPAAFDQLTANDMGKYLTYRANRAIASGGRVLAEAVNVGNHRELVQFHADRVLGLLRLAHVTLPRPAKLVLSHHNGLANFEKVGCGMVTVVDTANYAKKLIVLLPNQRHPAHKHHKKIETFNVVHGVVDFVIDGTNYRSDQSSQVTVHPGDTHSFSTTTGAVIEEVSTACLPDDSEYMEPVDANRKTEVFIP